MRSDVLIIGAGQAALECAASLRKNGYEGTITLIGEEVHPPYQRPPLSKAYLLGEMDAARLELRGRDFYTNGAITLLTGRQAVAIDRTAKTVKDDQGTVYHYGDLVLATGARVRKLPVPGADLAGVFYLRTLTDIDLIGPSLAQAQNVAVIGAGFIGLEFAAVARKQGKNVTIIEAADRVMGRAVTEDISRYFEGLHRKHGSTVLTGTGVSGLVGQNDKLQGVTLANGEVIATDLALVGIGVIANCELAVEAGLDCGNGIVVDEHGLTSDPHIYAAGDCVLYHHPFAGEPVRLESVQNAIDQAKSVAAAISGTPQPYHAVPWFWSDQFDIKLQIAGLSTGTDTHVVRGNVDEDKFSIFHFRNGDLRAVDSINSAGDHMVARRLLASGKPITPEQAGDPNLVLKTLLV
ncbi:FAD-dependent oxidoreductase [Rhizobium sp. L1K21]|nr:FAD-dependent oxidoreductase [Rhizobium sp. L1K21]